TKKRVNVFALSIYRLIIFLKDEAVLDLFDWLDKSVTPIPTILAKTFKSLSTCLENGLQEEGVERRAHWMIPNKILNRCADFDWVPLFEIWRAIGYASLLVLRLYRFRQFIPAMQGLAWCKFVCKGDITRKRWWGKIVNDYVLMSSQENTRPIEEHLQVNPSELEIIKQDFENRSS
ncbi:hypothetical protein Goari_018724, partial [Gossypium aridum]|nr:hypothetical protein [Gossypium aridum]